MPLHNGKRVPLLEKPTDLKPGQLVFQVRFRDEVFTDYREYIKRMDFYRRRVWSCEVTRDCNLTFEEALVSEKREHDNAKQFPFELVAPVLYDVQYCMAPLTDLVDCIVRKFQGPLYEGCESYGRKNNRVYPCKVVKILDNSDLTWYEVEWLDYRSEVTGNGFVKGRDLLWYKVPFTREVLESFIKVSTYRKLPWIIHESLAKKLGISTNPPALKQVEKQEEVVVYSRKRKNPIVNQSPSGQLMKYPIEDLLVPTGAKRPTPRRDFNVPIDCVGDLLMLWEFCNSFGRFLRLSPFSLEDFEDALCHKGSSVLMAESHLALLRLLVKDKGKYLETLLKKKRDAKITLVTWSDYLCDFLEMPGVEELSTHCETIRRGRYGYLDVKVKLQILEQLVSQSLATDIFREDLDDNIDVRQALTAARRDEALEEGRKKREEKRLNVACDTKVSSTPGTSGNVNPKRAVHKLMKDGIKGVIENKNKEERKEYLNREIEKRYVGTHPVGKDRYHNRYWFFKRDGRIFVESSDYVKWGYYCTKGELDALMVSLNSKGVRERDLKRKLRKYYDKICVALQKRAEITAQRREVEEDDTDHAFMNYTNDL